MLTTLLYWTLVYNWSISLLPPIVLYNLFGIVAAQQNDDFANL